MLFSQKLWTLEVAELTIVTDNTVNKVEDHMKDTDQRHLTHKRHDDDISGIEKEIGLNIDPLMAGDTELYDNKELVNLQHPAYTGLDGNYSDTHGNSNREHELHSQGSVTPELIITVKWNIQDFMIELMQSQPHTLGRNSTEGRPRVRVCLLVQAGNNVKDNRDINKAMESLCEV